MSDPVPTPDPASKPCAKCGTPFVPRKAGGGRVQQFCSRQCNIAVQNAKRGGQYRQTARDASVSASRGGRKAAASPIARGACPVTSERDYSDEEREFQMAVDRYKREEHRPFPTLREVLDVLKALGYRKVTTEPPEETV